MPTPSFEPELKAAQRQRARRLVRRIGIGAILLGLIATGVVALQAESFRPHMLIATFIAASGSLALAGALMGLIFFSNASGHDDDAARPDL